MVCEPSTGEILDSIIASFSWKKSARSKSSIQGAFICSIGTLSSSFLSEGITNWESLPILSIIVYRIYSFEHNSKSRIYFSAIKCYLRCRSAASLLNELHVTELMSTVESGIWICLNNFVFFRLNSFSRNLERCLQESKIFSTMWNRNAIIRIQWNDWEMMWWFMGKLCRLPEMEDTKSVRSKIC